MNGWAKAYEGTSVCVSGSSEGWSSVCVYVVVYDGDEKAPVSAVGKATGGSGAYDANGSVWGGSGYCSAADDALYWVVCSATEVCYSSDVGDCVSAGNSG